VNSSALVCLLLLISTPDCATRAPLAGRSLASSQPSASLQSPTGLQPQTGDLIVYSATYAPTLEQSEYRAHTNYTIATSDDKIIEHVTNATGSFASKPATVSLPPGEYHVRAQYDGGRFVIVPIVIVPDKITVLDLDGEVLPRGSGAPKEMVRLPNGHVVGWSATAYFTL
jgi:hypothetical protein